MFQKSDTPHGGSQSARMRKPEPVVRILRSQHQLEIWLCHNGKLQSLAGTVNAALAVDALRHGQDLVGEFVEQALRESERRSTLL
jgi:hypothetical protein